MSACSIGMFNGLKKMVGKGTDDTPNINHLHPAIHPAVLSNMPSNKFTKKRKVAEKEYPPSVKKKYEMINFFTIIFINFYFLCTSIILIHIYFFFFQKLNICINLTCFNFSYVLGE